MDGLYRAQDDPVGTLYPADQLPPGVVIKNTKPKPKKDTDEEFSGHLWANGTLPGCLDFVDRRKGGVVTKKQQFLVAAVHPDNKEWHKFRQDMIWNERSRHLMIPNNREHFMKSSAKATFDAFWEVKWVEGNDIPTYHKVHDPKGLFHGGSKTWESASVLGDCKPAAKEVIEILD